MAASTSNSATYVAWLVEPTPARILRFSDCAILLTAGILTHRALWAADAATWPPRQGPELLLLLVGVLVTPHVYNLFHLYGPRPLTAFRVSALVQAQLIVAGCLGAFVVLLDTKPVPFASWLFWWQLLTLAGVLSLRWSVRAIVRLWPGTARLTRNVVIVGMPSLAKKLAGQFSTAGDPTMRLIGLFHDPQYPPSPDCPFPVLGSSDDLVAFARATPVDEVIVALPWDAEDRLAEWMRLLRNIPCDVLLSPPDTVGVSPKCAIENLAGMTLLKVAGRPLAGEGYVAKVIEDRLLSGLLVVALSPLMLAIALLIRLDSPGPVLFRQKRHGFNNNVIDVLKFRTMAAGAGQTGTGQIVQVSRNDPRVTRVGRWLRQTSLDELPQLFNVLRGEMSLVGPRPHAVAHNEQYVGVINAYLSRHRVKPGITGWAQVNGNRGETDTLEKMEKRVQYDLFYIENWSLLLDQLILIRTVGVVLFGRNAY